MSIFTLKSLESFNKKSADKIWVKNDKEIKVSPIMPIRVKGLNFLRREVLQSFKALLKQEGPKMCWDGDRMIVFWPGVFSSSTVFLEGSTLNSSFLLHKAEKAGNFKKEIFSAFQQNFGPCLFCLAFKKKL